MQLGTDQFRRMVLIQAKDSEIGGNLIRCGQKLFDKVYSIKGGY